MLFKRKIERQYYDEENQIPLLRRSTEMREEIAGFKDKTSGKFQEVMLITCEKDLKKFKEMYGLTELKTEDY